jgi:peptidylprolyl isomerase
MTEVKNGDVVRVHYTARLTDGTEFDSTAARGPLELEIGAGQVLPGLDRRIDGLTVGETSTVTVPAEEAYGVRDEARVQTVPRSAVPEGTEIGTRLQANTPDGSKVALTVVDIDDERATVDANHPFAGEDLVVDVEIVEIVAHGRAA